MIEPTQELKMWVAVREDITMSRGKFAAQVGHAFGRLYLSASRLVPNQFQVYLEHNEAKITVKVKDEAALLRVAAEAKAFGVPCELIRDAGRSELEPGTATVCAFGPALREKIGPYLKRLQVLKEPPTESPPVSTPTADSITAN
ncbi:MAG: aminoacyl-tRNA hydrolase [Oxalobacteraceae bacterium]|nr:MAG: aminoacyl-tRNA hydrolase [Oxalobacteraceae bacterium]